jgi:hypothetical protein
MSGFFRWLSVACAVCVGAISYALFSLPELPSARSHAVSEAEEPANSPVKLVQGMAKFLEKAPLNMQAEMRESAAKKVAQAKPEVSTPLQSSPSGDQPPDDVSRFMTIRSKSQDPGHQVEALSDLMMWLQNDPKPEVANLAQDVIREMSYRQNLSDAEKTMLQHAHILVVDSMNQMSEIRIPAGEAPTEFINVYEPEFTQ